MAGELTIDVDATNLLRLLDQLDDRAGEALKMVAKETAERIRTEARARLSRQTSGTGQTAEAITIEDIKGGYKVYVAPVSGRAENVPLWLEFGTQRATSRPFLFAAAVLEEGNHLRRLTEALQDELTGLGA